MAKIRKEIIDKILDTAKIEEVVMECLGEYGPQNRAGLKKCGVRYKALCPFHNDHSMGSFIVHPNTNTFKCFSCEHKGGPVDFLMKYEHLSYPDAIRWLGKMYHIDVDNVPVDWHYTPRPAPPPLKRLKLPMWMVQNTANLTRDPLIEWIRTIKWDSVSRARIDEVLTAYYVGHGKHGHTIFWQVDENGEVRTGKMMKYYPKGHPRFGHRDKESDWNFDWVHATLCRVKNDGDPWPFPHLYNPDTHEHELTFFGMHLLDVYPKATIKLVESEKTALLMAIAYGNHAQQVWMACGGISLLTRERLKPIIDRGRRVILYPDRDGIEKWRVKAEQMHYERLTIDTEPVTKWWAPEDGEKADIADVVVRIINQSKPMKTIADVETNIPQAKAIIDKYNLEIINDNE